VAHVLPAECVSRLDDLRIVMANVGIQCHGTADVVLLHDVDHAPYSDPHPVIAPCVIQHVGYKVRRNVGDRRGRAVEREVFDVRHDPDRNPCTVWKPQRLTFNDR